MVTWKSQFSPSTLWGPGIEPREPCHRRMCGLQLGSWSCASGLPLVDGGGALSLQPKAVREKEVQASGAGRECGHSDKRGLRKSVGERRQESSRSYFP